MTVMACLEAFRSTRQETRYFFFAFLAAGFFAAFLAAGFLAAFLAAGFFAALAIWFVLPLIAGYEVPACGPDVHRVVRNVVRIKSRFKRKFPVTIIEIFDR